MTVLYNIKTTAKRFLLKIIEPYLLRKYKITELPFCLETFPVKEWGKECDFIWIVENDNLETLEEI